MKEESGHTPAPWASDFNGKGCWTVRGRAENPLYVCRVAEGIECSQNARLIAAAPELLSALEPLWAWAENERRKHRAAGEENEAAFMGEKADNARSAIAKAKGTR